MQALPFIMAAGTAVSGVTSYMSSQYQAQVAENNATIAGDAAVRGAFNENQDMMAKDIAARQEIANVVAEMGASGLSANSGSKLLQRTSLADLATRDRERLAANRDVNLKNKLQEKAAFKAEAKSAKTAGMFGLLTSVLQVPTSYLSGATALNQYRKSALALTNPSYI